MNGFGTTRERILAMRMDADAEEEEKQSWKSNGAVVLSGGHSG